MRRCPQLRLARAFAASAKPGAGRTYGLGALCGVGLGGCGFGLALGQWDAQLRLRQLPACGRVCCEDLTAAQKALPEKLRAIVGKQHVAENVIETGTMVGQGHALLVARPGTLKEAQEVLKACVEADVAVYPQGAKTGITGGSVPRDGGDRPSVVINMKRLEKILPIGEGQQVLCFAGAGIFSVQEALKAVSRDSHSVLGSIFLNPSVAAGVAFGSGGTQIHKGPAFTERALFLRVGKDGTVELVNTLGLKPQDDVLSFLEEAKALSASDVDPACRRSGSWPKYRQQLCQLDAKVSRYNADTTGEDCCRSEGKVLILATIHDTFPLPKESKTVWISCKDFATAQLMKEKVALASAECLPKQLEYLSRAQFDCCDQGGRVLVKLIEMVGMMNLGTLWNFKLKFESLPIPFANLIADKMLWYLNPIFPESLPKQIMKQGKEFDHHLIMEMTEFGGGELRRLEEALQKQMAKLPEGQAQLYECKEDWEKSRVMLFRFAVQPSIRTLTVGKGKQGLIIDYALPKNHKGILELPDDFPVEMRCLCSHFGCNVYHESMMLSTGVDVHEVHDRVAKLIEAAGGKVPAEHGHGTEYEAPSDTKQRWQRIDPRNVMNPGVGGSSSLRNYA